MDLRFIGENGSLGLRFGQIYRLTLKPHDRGIMMTGPVYCPYASQEAFWRNWAHPSEELRTIMEAKGSALRQRHIPHDGEPRATSVETRHSPSEFRQTPIQEEPPTLQCSRLTIHGSHNWGSEKICWCPGKTI